MTTTCTECGQELTYGDYPFCPHGSIYEGNAQRFDPIVVHRDAAGNYRFPGASDAPLPAGYEKVELRSFHEVRRFESEMNRREAQRHDGVSTRRAEDAAAVRSHLRGELRDAMSRMSPYGRDFARLAMAMSDNAPRRSFDPGFFVEVLSNDSSNRDPHRDARTGWKGKKG